jgi:hypothetical protein
MLSSTSSSTVLSGVIEARACACQRLRSGGQPTGMLGFVWGEPLRLLFLLYIRPCLPSPSIFLLLSGLATKSAVVLSYFFDDLVLQSQRFSFAHALARLLRCVTAPQSERCPRIHSAILTTPPLRNATQSFNVKYFWDKMNPIKVLVRGEHGRSLRRCLPASGAV